MTALHPYRLPTDDKAALVDRLPGQFDQQPVELCLDLDSGDLQYRVNPEHGDSRPARHAHGCVQTWSVPSFTPEVANQLLDEICEDAQRLLNDAETVWDGDNTVGELGPDAQAAYEDIAAAIRVRAELAERPGARDLVYISDTHEYLSDPTVIEHIASTYSVTRQTSDADLDRIAARLAADALADDNVVLYRVEGWLNDLRASRPAISPAT